MRIQVHRGGLNPRDKRKFEQMMKDGDLDVLACTPTLELGIDIGQVDVATSAFKMNLIPLFKETGGAERVGKKSLPFVGLDLKKVGVNIIPGLFTKPNAPTKG